MLSVSAKILNALADDVALRFHAEASKHVLEAVGGKSDIADIASFVTYGIQRAKVHGIVDKKSVIGFLDLMLAHGMTFDTDDKRKGFVRALGGGTEGWQKVNRARMLGEGRDADAELADMGV